MPLRMKLAAVVGVGHIVFAVFWIGLTIGASIWDRLRPWSALVTFTVVPLQISFGGCPLTALWTALIGDSFAKGGLRSGSFLCWVIWRTFGYEMSPLWITAAMVAAVAVNLVWVRPILFRN